MKRDMGQVKDLGHMDAREILVHSRAMSGLTNDKVAHAMDLGEETVSLYQRDPGEKEHQYGLPLRRIRSWCKAVGNDLVIRWAAQQCGGMFVRVDRDCPKDMNLTAQMGRVNKEAGEAIGALLSSLADGNLDEQERNRVCRELADLITVAQEALLAAQGKSTTGTA